VASTTSTCTPKFSEGLSKRWSSANHSCFQVSLRMPPFKMSRINRVLESSQLLASQLNAVISSGSHNFPHGYQQCCVLTRGSCANCESATWEEAPPDMPKDTLRNRSDQGSGLPAALA
jgi:hypothetical protein